MGIWTQGEMQQDVDLFIAERGGGGGQGHSGILMPGHASPELDCTRPDPDERIVSRCPELAVTNFCPSGMGASTMVRHRVPDPHRHAGQAFLAMPIAAYIQYVPSPRDRRLALFCQRCHLAETLHFGWTHQVRFVLMPLSSTSLLATIPHSSTEVLWKGTNMCNSALCLFFPSSLSRRGIYVDVYMR